MIIEFEIFEKFRITNQRVYCIYIDDKIKSFTVGKYYDVYTQPTIALEPSLKVKNNNGTLKDLAIYDKKEKLHWATILSKNIDPSIPLYYIYFSRVGFIKEEDVEDFELHNLAYKYNI